MPYSPALRLHLVVASSQPLCATAAEIDEAVAKAYEPLIRALEDAPQALVSLHFGGHLLDHLARRHEALLLRIKQLVVQGQVEILGGPFYGGAPALLPETDLRAQIAMAGEFWDSFVGMRPRGFFLPDCAWTPELPRLLAETELRFGFVMQEQLLLEHEHVHVGRLERGGDSTLVLPIDGALSFGHAFGPEAGATQGFIRALENWQPPAKPLPLQAMQPPMWRTRGRIASVFLPAELFGLLGHSTSFAHLIGALVAHQSIHLVLAGATVAQATRAPGLSLSEAYRPLLPPYLPHDALKDWAEMPLTLSEADTLYRRMLKTSRRLHQAIAAMEDAQMEAGWGDSLATAQRHLFAAQSFDALGRGRFAGVADPDVRDAALGRLIEAESLIDGVIGSGNDGRIECEDIDGNLVEDVFVRLPHSLVWLTPSLGPNMRAFEINSLQRNVLDAGSRRVEPWYAQATVAPYDAQGDAQAIANSRPLPKKQAQLPREIDSLQRRGVRDHLVDNTLYSLFDVLTGRAQPVCPRDLAYQVQPQSTDLRERGQPILIEATRTSNFRVDGAEVKGDFYVATRVGLPGPTGESEAHAVSFRCSMEFVGLKAEQSLLWALEVPMRLAYGVHAVHAAQGEALQMNIIYPNQAELFVSVPKPRARASEHNATQRPHLVAHISTIFHGPGKSGLACVAAPMNTTLRDPDGYRAVDQGICLALGLEGCADKQGRLRLDAEVVLRLKAA